MSAPQTGRVPGFGADETRAELQRLAGPLFTAVGRSGAAMVVTNPRLPDNPIVFVNAAFGRLTGYVPDEVLNLNCRLLQGPDTDPQTRRQIGAALQAAVTVNVEILNYRRDGTSFWNGLCITPLPGADGVTAFFLATQSDVTEARMADPSVRSFTRNKTHDRLRVALARSGAAAAWEWNIRSGRIAGDAWFASLYNITGEEAEDGIAPAQFFSLIHPQDQTRMRLAIGGMLRGAELLSKECRLLLADGTVRWMHARARSHYDATDRPESFSGVLVDITEQKRVEEQLRIAQTAGGVGTFEYSYGFATISVSAQFCRLLGLHANADLPIRTVNRVVLPGDPLLLDTAAAPTGTIASQIETRIRRPDTGEIRWLSRRGEYVDDPSAGYRFSGVIYDITAAKQVEEQLRLLNETLEARVAERTRERDLVWRTSQDLFVLCDLQGLVRSINPAWFAALGHSADTILGRHLEELVHPDDADAARAQLARLQDGAIIRDLDLRLRTHDDSYRRYSWHCIPEGDQFYAAGRDVTERYQLEEQLRQSQKMEAVGQLTGGIAHDFNNLLTGIMGSLELLGTRVAQGRFGEVERYVSAAQGAGRRAAALTHRLLAFSRRQTLEPKAISINKLIAGLEELVRRTVGPSIAVETSMADGLWTTMVDPNQLENALLNLCINARDAMPDGGRISIETANMWLDERAARIREVLPGHYVSLSVVDTGTGMTPEVIARVFDPFFTTKPIGKGTGLGLSMIYGFVRQSGGQVRISSEPGEGTTMCLYIPRHHGDEDTVEAPVAGTTDLNADQGETVLIVDDEPTVRMLVMEILQDLGYVAIEAADGVTGIQILQSGIRIDLLVTDVGLPGGLNGRQVADAGRLVRPGLKVLFITGYAESAVFGNAHLDPGMHLLTKPFALDVLASRIKELIGG